MKNSIIAFLAGALTALLIYLKKKNPDIVNVSGDLIEEQKIKDNRKIKNRRLQEIRKRESFTGSALITSDMSRREVIRLWKSTKNN